MTPTRPYPIFPLLALAGLISLGTANLLAKSPPPTGPAPTSGQPYLGEADAKLELGEITIAQPGTGHWEDLTFANTYLDPVIIFSPPTDAETDPVLVRLRNITPNGCQFQLHEGQNHDGIHQAETLHYLVAEAGTYQMGGLQWEAGKTQGQIGTPNTSTFHNSFPSTPAILAQGASPTATASPQVWGTTATGFKFQTQGKGPSPTPDSPIHWVAIQPGTGALADGATPFEVGFATGQQSTGHLQFAKPHQSPYLYAHLQDRADDTPTALRQTSLTPTTAELRIPLSPETAAQSPARPIAYLVFEDADDNTLPTTADTDGDGMPDTWETANGLAPLDPSDATLDTDGDGLTNLAEHAAGTSPTDYYNGLTPTITILSGDRQQGAPDTRLAENIVIQVTNGAGTPYPNAPLHIRPQDIRALVGDGSIPTPNMDATTVLRTDAEGKAQLLVVP